MDKEELMKLVRVAGCTVVGDRILMNAYDLHNLKDAILERAATVAESEPKVWDLDAPSPQQRIAAKIRAMKG